MNEEKQLMKQIFEETTKDADFGVKILYYSVLLVLSIVTVVFLAAYLSIGKLQVISEIIAILLTLSIIGIFVGASIMAVAVNIQEVLSEYILSKKTKEQQQIIKGDSREKTNKTKKSN